MKWVFVHGAGSSADFWQLQRPFFPGALFLDLPGHSSRRLTHPGAAQEPTHSNDKGLASIPAYAAWVIGQIEQQSSEVVLVGHSMGGAIALTVALARPELLAGLVLASTGAKLTVNAELLQLLAAHYLGAVDWIMKYSFAPSANRYKVEGVRRQLLRTPQQTLLDDYSACAGFDVTANLLAGEIAAPTVVVCGTADKMTPPKYSQFLADHIKTSALGLIPDAGHMAPLEKPEQWAKTVQELWASLEQPQ